MERVKAFKVYKSLAKRSARTPIDSRFSLSCFVHPISGAKPMQQAWRSMRATAVMAAIVTTMLCGPVGALLAPFSFAFLWSSLHPFLTFAAPLKALVGRLVLCLLTFLAP